MGSNVRALDAQVLPGKTGHDRVILLVGPPPFHWINDLIELHVCVCTFLRAGLAAALDLLVLQAMTFEHIFESDCRVVLSSIGLDPRIRNNQGGALDSKLFNGGLDMGIDLQEPETVEVKVKDGNVDHAGGDRERLRKTGS